MPAADSTLATIRIKVRRLTRSPSVNQLSDNDIDQYVNTAILYDFPQHLRLNTLLTTITWYTQAYIDSYLVDTSLSTNDPLYDFENRYITIDAPVYIAGQRAYYTQSRDVFFGAYPNNTLIENFATGDGVTLNPVFTGTFSNIPLVQNSVIFSAIDTNNATQTYIDQPTSVSLGQLVNASTGAIVVADTVNYITGQYHITLSGTIKSGSNIVRQSLSYTPAMPTALLYYNLSRINPATDEVTNNKVFTVRPIPDGAYPINIQVFRQPMQLLAYDQSPELSQWWQYIAYLAAKKVFEDRLDTESIQQIMPELKKQEALVLSKKVVQNTTQRAATIYSPQLDNNPYFGTNGWWQGPLG